MAAAPATGVARRRRPVPRRLTNLALLLVLALVLLSGVGSWLVGEPTQAWVVVAHGVGGLLVVLLVRWKAPVIRSGWSRSRRSRWLSAALAALTVLALLTGVLHSTGLVTAAAGQLMMWWHVAAGLLLLPLLAWHATSHRQPVRRTDLDRRLLLRSGGLLVVAGAAWAAVEGLVRLADLPGARRRFTGSYASDLPRPTIWLSDRVPDVDPGAWRLTVTTPDRIRTWTVAELREQPAADVRAVIDCTSGWYSDQQWAGPTLAHLVGPVPAGGSVVVRSATGYSRRFAPDELDRVLLAHTMAGQPLLEQLGAPLRLVVPGRRGFWWVKWVDRVEVDDRPAWWQPTFPLQ
ncbi:molybdopterin-dependent oxidoreductase [Aquipuribacter sp. MA13-6]|uniref:molybdopterin-dependent oxidoreductase n=1 Tax=unclassified Aquipuribacter TaxID=2635084 RepID=UPI003EEF7068